MNNKAPYFLMLGALTLAFTFMWSTISGPLSYQAREQRRLERPMNADALAALVERCDAAHGVPRVRMVETGENVGMVNAAYCELSNEEPINGRYFGLVRIDGELEHKSDFKDFPRE